MMKTILIVDDSPVIRSVIKIFLESLRYTFVEAGSAAEALTRLETHRVDLAILDVNMPGTSGLALVQKMRAHTRADIRALPIVLLTADRSRDLPERNELAGADAVLRKPVSSAGLMALVRRFAPPPLVGASA